MRSMLGLSASALRTGSGEPPSDPFPGLGRVNLHPRWSYVTPKPISDRRMTQPAEASRGSPRVPFRTLSFCRHSRSRRQSPFWEALEEIRGGSRAQRCCVRKTRNVLTTCPGRPGEAEARPCTDLDGRGPRRRTEAFDSFRETYEAKHPKATNRLVKDRKKLLAFYDFPTNHCCTRFAVARLVVD